MIETGMPLVHESVPSPPPADPLLTHPATGVRQRAAVALVLILSAAAALRFAALGQESFWVDEIHSLRIAQTGGPVAILTALRDDVHPPFFFWVLHGWLAIAPATEVGARSLSALIGVLSVAALYGWGRALRLPRTACLLAAALLAIHPHALWYSQEVRMYGLETLLGTFHLLLTARVLHPTGIGRTGDRIGVMFAHPYSRTRFLLARGLPWFFVGAMLLWTHFYGVFFLAAEAAWAAALSMRLKWGKAKRNGQGAKSKEQRENYELRIANSETTANTQQTANSKQYPAKSWWGGPWSPLTAVAFAGIGWVIIALPLIAQSLDRMRSGQGIAWLSAVYPLTWRTPGEMANSLVCGPEIRGGPWWLRAAALVAALVLIAAGLRNAGQSLRRKTISGAALRRSIPALIFLLLYLLPLLVSLYRVIVLGGQRYLTVAVPPLCLAMAVGVHRLAARRRVGRSVLAVAAVLAVVAAQGLYLREYFTGREKRMWREAVRFVEANARRDDVVCTLPGYSLGILDYYRPAPARPEPIERVPTLTPGPDRIWVLSVSPVGSLQEKSLLQGGWQPTLNQTIHDKWASTLIRITLFQRRAENGITPGTTEPRAKASQPRKTRAARISNGKTQP